MKEGRGSDACAQDPSMPCVCLAGLRICRQAGQAAARCIVWILFYLTDKLTFSLKGVTHIRALWCH